MLSNNNLSIVLTLGQVDPLGVRLLMVVELPDIGLLDTGHQGACLFVKSGERLIRTNLLVQEDTSIHNVQP